MTTLCFCTGSYYRGRHNGMLGEQHPINLLGTKYSGIVIASDFGGLLTQAELDILNARSGDIISFLNDGGGLYAMAESNSGAGLTPDGGHFGFLPFVVSSTVLNSSEAGITVTSFGAGLGLTNADVSANFSHNVFTNDAGLNVVDTFPSGAIVSIAGRIIIQVPEPASLGLLGFGLMMASFARRTRSVA